MSDISKQSEPVNVSLDVVWQGTAGKFDARLSEISMEGCFIDSLGQEVIGEIINFRVHLPTGPWITLQGQVINQEYPVGFELRFTQISEENRRLLLQVIAAHGGKQAQEILKTEGEREVAAQTPHNSLRVLVADDDAMILEIVKAVVEAQGYSVVTVQDGRQAFRVLQADADFSAAIFDMKMPHLDGLDLIQYMKMNNRLRDIPIGMITAQQDPKVWDESVAAGASVFLPKPFTPPQIQMMLRVLINKGKLWKSAVFINKAKFSIKIIKLQNG